MSPTATGRHCQLCEKSVVDFSRKTTAEILAYLARPSAGQVCGRLRAAQLPPTARLLSWRAAPKLALSIAAVLALTHCTPDVPPNALPATVANAEQAGATARGHVLDRDSRTPLAGALIVCEADTLLQTRTAADGSFVLNLPPHLTGSKLIATMPQRPTGQGSEGELLIPYVPHYFTAGPNTMVLLRQIPMMVGEIEPERSTTHGAEKL